MDEDTFKAGMKEAYLKIQTGIFGCEEFLDYSPDGMIKFRQMVNSLVKNDWRKQLKAWGIDKREASDG